MNKKNCIKWIEISLDNLVSNFLSLSKYTKSKQIAVIKSNAYGHGLIQVASALENLKSKYLLGFAVLDVEEALALRKANITSPILLFNTAGGYISEDEAEIIIREKLTPTVCNLSVAEKLHAKVNKLKAKPLGIHIKLDTGMGRFGVLYNKAYTFISKLKNYSNLRIEGIYSHFSSAELEDKSYALLQLSRFSKSVAKLYNKNSIILHMANSAAALEIEASRLDAIRPGIALYGIYPSKRRDIKLSPVLTFKAKILDIRELPKGSYISYGMTYCTRRKSKIGVIPVGYADGYHRLLSGSSEVIINGKYKAPVVGNITMDFFMVDLTDLPHVKLGDEVELFGKNIPVDEVAKRCNTIPYELLSNLNLRILRFYSH